MKFELFIALHYLFARRKQAFIYLISLMSILGVAIGVALSLAQIGIDYAEKAAQLRINQIIENQRLEQIRSRAGYSFNRSRMGAE